MRRHGIGIHRMDSGSYYYNQSPHHPTKLAKILPMRKRSTSESLFFLLRGTEKTTSADGRKSKRQRLLDLVRRFRSLLANDVWQRQDVSTIQILDETKERTSQGEKVAVVRSSDSGQGTLLEDLPSTRDVSIIDETNNTTLVTTTPRSTRSAEHVDLSGTWKPIVTDEFKAQYDRYLANCSQSFMFRKIVVNGIVMQKEVIRQLNEGMDLEIIATNPAGNWNRTLTTSNRALPINVTITDPDGDKVQIEAWWADEGTKHTSILRGKPNVEGGYFETVRYLESNEVLVCEAKFYPPSPSSSTTKDFYYGHVIWKFQRDKK